MIMEPPPGYPPPTLVRKKSRGPFRFGVLFFVLFAGLGFILVTRLLEQPSEPPPPAPAAADPGGVGDADAAPAALPDSGQIIVEKPVEEGAAAAKAPDARKPNRWYFIDRLGDGPGAIYSRDGSQWNFAFACTSATRTIEFIAVGTGSPGTFVDQSISVGKVKLMMDASYSKDGGGTISTILPASHPFLKALDGSAPMEVKLHALRKTIVPVDANVVRLIGACRGRP